jgi:hypothetical protein
MQHAGARSTLVNQRHSGASNNEGSLHQVCVTVNKEFRVRAFVDKKQVGAKVQRRIASLESFKRLLPDLRLDDTIRPSQDLLCQDRDGISAV